jgi:hypothetical protein
MSAVIDKAIAALPSEQQSEWAEIQHGARDPLDTLSAWTPEHRLAITLAWSDWARSQTNASVVLRTISAWSLRLAVLLACRVAREALRYVPDDEHRPIRAIKAAEGWARGEVSEMECGRAAADAVDAASTTVYAATSAASAAYAAVYAADDATAAVADAADAAAAYVAYAAAADATTDTAYAAAYDTNVDVENSAIWQRARDAELHRLCVVIADDMLKGHAADWML